MISSIARNTKLGVLFFLLIMGCANEEGSSVKETAIIFNDISCQKELKGEAIQLPGIINNELYFYYIIVRDTLLFCFKNKSDPYYLDIYNLNSFEIVSNIGKKGKGPNEVISLRMNSPNLYSDYFVIEDIEGGFFMPYNMDSLLQFQNDYSPPKYRLYAYMDHLQFMENGDVFGLNTFYFNEDGFNNNVPPFFEESASGLEDVGSKYIGRFFTNNVTQHSRAVFSPEGENVFLFYGHKNTFEIYNNYDVLKRIHLGEAKKSSFINIGEMNVVFDEEYGAFDDYFSTNSGVYIIYRNGRERNEGNMILKFSWEGKLLCKYILDQQNVLLWPFSIGKDEEYLYATCSNWSCDSAKIFKFKL